MIDYDWKRGKRNVELIQTALGAGKEAGRM